MTEGTINWGELMAGVAEQLKPVPKGTYDVVVSKAEPKTSSTNKAMWATHLQIEGGPHNGRVVYNNVTLTTDNPQALRMFFVNMAAFGLDQQFFASNPSPQAIANALVGRRARVELDHRMYQGQTRENVKRLMPAGGILGGMSGGSGIPGAPTAPSPVVAPAPIPTPPQAAPAIPAPQPQPVPVPPATPQVPVQESTVPIPAPQAPAPEEISVVPDEPVEQENQIPFPDREGYASEPAVAPEPAPVLPPGMTQEDFDKFTAWQASQQQAAPVPEATPQPAAQGAVSPPPPVPF